MFSPSLLFDTLSNHVSERLLKQVWSQSFCKSVRVMKDLKTRRRPPILLHLFPLVSLPVDATSPIVSFTLSHSLPSSARALGPGCVIGGLPKPNLWLHVISGWMESPDFPCCAKALTVPICKFLTGAELVVNGVLVVAWFT